MNDTPHTGPGAVFRDSKDWYLGKGGEIAPSPPLIALCRGRAGKRILDIGCAVGNYCIELQKAGFLCTGVDVNPAYIEKARAKGIDAHVVSDAMLFGDGSFDTVIMFEVLEHAKDPVRLITEAKRVAKKNILLTVPDNTCLEALRGVGLTYEHMLEHDHINFYTKDSLGRLLAGSFNRYVVWEGEGRFVHHLLPWYVRKPLTLLEVCGLLKPTFYTRLYAECFV